MVAISLALVALLFAAAFYTNHLVNYAAQSNQRLIDRQREFAEHLTLLKGTLYAMEKGIYQYAALLDDGQRVRVESLLATAQLQAEELNSFVLSRSDPQIRLLGERIDASLVPLHEEITHLLGIIGDIEKRFPASSIITGATYPANVRFLSAVEAALAESETSAEHDQQRISELLKELRYQWAQHVSVVRVFIANRSGVFGMPERGMLQHLRNRENYVATIRNILDELAHYDGEGRLGLLQSESLKAMRHSLDEFERHFDEVVEIYRSGSWRADIPLIKQRIEPLFEELWIGIAGIDTRLAIINSSKLRDTIDTADGLSRFLWLITGFAAVILLAGLLAYEFVLRRPIYQVINALEALGEGVSYSPALTTRTTETERLLRAFRNMQRQVNARETRLASILDNASEGIITVNEHGGIEKFNNAAEALFGYSSEEIVGQDVSVLMPHAVREERKRFIQHYLATGEKRGVGHEINIDGRHKDGRIFPLSIKLSDMIIEGKRYYTAIVSDISERKAMLDRLRHLAEHDSLTGLYNRQYFNEELERVVERALRQNGLNCALLYIDLDNFKYVNDTLGHLAGDQVLVEVGALLVSRSRGGDLVARLGGDEFAILLYDVDPAQAMQAAEGYRQQLAEYTFKHRGKIIDIGCSIGVATLSDGLNGKEELLARADLSCHMAKRTGRNCVHLYEPDDRASMVTMQTDMGWARIIKDAIDSDRFRLALQPIVDIESRRPVCQEVLLRMHSEDGALVMPAGFLPSAERFGLILHIDRWVVSRAIRLLAQSPGERFSINLSAMSIGDGEVLRLITEGLERHSLEPGRVTFEITETVAIANLAAAAEFLDGLRALGCRTALDDFGVGYCSFAYLKDLPVDYVKIDGSFVRAIGSDALQLAMVKSMNEIAHAMGKKTVAEYVEEERILAMLHGIGVDFVQGYLLGKPRLVERSTPGV